MKVLIACEESQEVCKAFRAKGHEAYSCDIQMCSGGHPEWHICNDVLDIINGNTDFFTCDGKQHTVETWDMIIAHPPCTYLTNVATRHYSLKCTPAEKVVERMKHREESIVFFMQIVSANAPKIAVENPIGRMNTVFRKADQIIHPYMFSNGPEDSEQFVTKATCLWLKGLPVLRPTYTGDKPDNGKLFGRYSNGKSRTWEETRHSGKDRAKVRSKTFKGIAFAMAEQWEILRRITMITKEEFEKAVECCTGFTVSCENCPLSEKDFKCGVYLAEYLKENEPALSANSTSSEVSKEFNKLLLDIAGLLSTMDKQCTAAYNAGISCQKLKSLIRSDGEPSD